jgi:hypothetical protein
LRTTDHSPGKALPVAENSKSPSPFDAAKLMVWAPLDVGAGPHAASKLVMPISRTIFSMDSDLVDDMCALVK